MEGFDPRQSFGYEVSQRYDTQPRGDERDTVAFLAKLADGGNALEFAVGTGRIALPLREAGVRVEGIELSQAMLRLRERWGGWHGEPFTASSWRHVSVYEPAPGR
jgi:hypothetical protein